MAKSNDNFKYEVNKDYDFILEESANTSICLRKISWNDRPEKLDIRKYTYSDGREQIRKGISLSDEAADELVHVLTKTGYGNTKKILIGIRDREDFQDSIDNIDTLEEFEDDGSEDYYDPSELLEEDKEEDLENAG